MEAHVNEHKSRNEVWWKSLGPVLALSERRTLFVKVKMYGHIAFVGTFVSSNDSGDWNARVNLNYNFTSARTGTLIQLEPTRTLAELHEMRCWVVPSLCVVRGQLSDTHTRNTHTHTHAARTHKVIAMLQDWWSRLSFIVAKVPFHAMVHRLLCHNVRPLGAQKIECQGGGLLNGRKGDLISPVVPKAASRSTLHKIGLCSWTRKKIPSMKPGQVILSFQTRCIRSGAHMHKHSKKS